MVVVLAKIPGQDRLMMRDPVSEPPKSIQWLREVFSPQALTIRAPCDPIQTLLPVRVVILSKKSGPIAKGERCENTPRLERLAFLMQITLGLLNLFWLIATKLKLRTIEPWQARIPEGQFSCIAADLVSQTNLEKVQRGVETL